MSKNVLFLSFMALWLFSSCASRKNFVYLNDMQMGEKYLIDTKYEAEVHCDDRLSILVSCKNPELAIPFNIQGGNFRVNADGSISPEAGAVKEKGYRVDALGDIDFPILGKLHVEGLKISEVKRLIETRIKQGEYIKDPLVAVEFLNFKYTVLGAVGRNGTFTVNGDRITLLEAIANAGDLTSKARIDRVKVIREVGNEKQMFIHDLRSTDIFQSPCFYLQQNDIVYVEPRYRKKDAEDRGWQITTVLISLASLVTSILWVLK
ncbi:polysaccharide biosynthesis/export family protein [Bacteroides caecigallinarum]|uniref:polysaccharide biosynthesis/export family protein n=1 Tax=Bacteroides caecigallinarum TaxID=1411144 RepID=UPI001958C1D0|nr:polysaccharide biosynthesis/export family protein [Bacteroides caecigallinarum]MBM6960806.1 polysaccharide biosynthesis/export family protein [Bacteroides caecigallinarum]